MSPLARLSCPPTAVLARGRGWLVLGTGVLLAGCAGTGIRQTPPPPATHAQIEKEIRYLQQSFLTDPCMARLRQAAPELSPGADQGGTAIYAVEFAQRPRAADRHTYRLQVIERERLAYLYTSGGTAGWYTVRGPLPLWQCMQDTVR